ncbi:hypothetical protein TNCV_854981 [Trichonephila clavipes]|nr:hypothetical protein TNCV_854981 [Trichonephila clavipes]
MWTSKAVWGSCLDYRTPHRFITGRYGLGRNLLSKPNSFGLTLQHDNAHPQTVPVVMNCLQACPTLLCSARSPNLCSIEHIWDIIGKLLQSSWNFNDLALKMEAI